MGEGRGPRRGAWTPEAVTFPRLCMSKQKNMDPWGGVRRARPLDPPMKTIQWIGTGKATIFFTCWITSHFQEFQSAAIGKKNKHRVTIPCKWSFDFMKSGRFHVKSTQNLINKSKCFNQNYSV